MPKASKPSGYSVECANIDCADYARRRPIDIKPLNRPRCNCGAELIVYTSNPRWFKLEPPDPLAKRGSVKAA